MTSNGKHQPIIVELAGPPGAGKSTLVDIFLKRNDKAYVVRTPEFRKLQFAPFFIWNTILLLPTVLKVWIDQRRVFTFRELALMAILTGWHRSLKRQAAANKNVIILDEGPVCILSKIYAHRSNALDNERSGAWWKAAYKRWAETLDFVIYLDTPEPILMKRIRERAAWQEVKFLSDEQSLNFLANIRNAHEHVLHEIKAQPTSPTIRSFDTSSLPTDMIFEEICPLMEEISDKR